MLDPNDDKLIVTTTHFSTSGPSSVYTLRWFRFRKVKNCEIQLPANGIILLDGKSGIGKTSILEAISFVLYDDAGNTCYPRSERASKKKHDSTWVQLTFPSGLIVYRQRRPNLLRVVDKNIDLSDDSAQAYLNRILGSLNNWLVGGYLRQMELCSFFSMSSDDKLKLLQQMSLSEHSTGMITSPEKFELLLNKTLEKIIVLTRQVNEAEMQVKVYSEMYMRLYNQCTEDVRSTKPWTLKKTSRYLKKYSASSTKDLLLQLRTQTNSKSQSMRSQISEAQIQVAQINENTKQRIRLQELLNENDIKLAEYQQANIEDIRQCEKDLNDITEQISLAQRTKKRSQLLAAKTETQRRLDLIPAETSKYNLSDLDKYDKILLGPTIQQAEEHLVEIGLAKEYQQKLNDHQKYQNASNQVDSLQRQLNSYPKISVRDEIEDVTEKIWILNLQQKKLTCPNCSASLQLNNGKLDRMEGARFRSHWRAKQMRMNLIFINLSISRLKHFINNVVLLKNH